MKREIKHFANKVYVQQKSFSLNRWLIKHPGFEFELTPRDPSCLPKEYTNAEGMCYFLDGYKHSTVTDKDASLSDHIEAAMRQINME